LLLFGTVFDKEASQTRDYLCRKERDTPRGSPKSFAVQRTLAQDDKCGFSFKPIQFQEKT
jgi:hypothetical protein